MNTFKCDTAEIAGEFSKIVGRAAGKVDRQFLMPFSSM